MSNAELTNRRLAQAPLQLGPPLAAQDRHCELQRSQLDRRFRFRLDRLRRVHLRQADESLETDVDRPRIDDLSLFYQRRQDHVRYRDLRIHLALLLPGIKKCGARRSELRNCAGFANRR